MQVLRERGALRSYTYGEHWAPHDIRVRELGSGKSRLEVAAGLGITFRVTPNIGVADGIDAVRLTLPRCWFDADRCEAGIQAFTHYRKTYNARLQEYSGTPVHDWVSHGTDAFRGLAVRHRPPKEETQPETQLISDFGGWEHRWMLA